jgi:hypothetical protein
MQPNRDRSSELQLAQAKLEKRLQPRFQHLQDMENLLWQARCFGHSDEAVDEWREATQVAKVRVMKITDALFRLGITWVQVWTQGGCGQVHEAVHACSLIRNELWIIEEGVWKVRWVVVASLSETH